LQNPSQSDGDNVKNLRSGTSRTFRNKKREYLEGKINELETNNKKNILETFIESKMNLKKGIKLELILKRMTVVIC
jgi:hypothetical protein